MTIFDNAAAAMTEHVPIYAYPRWFSSLIYCLNYLKSNKDSGDRNKFSNEAVDYAHDLFEFSFARELKILSDASIEMKFSSAPLVLPQIYNQEEFEILQAQDSRKKKEERRIQLRPFLDDVDKTMERVAPKLNPLVV